MATPQERIDAATGRVLHRLNVLQDRPGVDLTRRLQSEVILLRAKMAVIESRITALGLTQAQFDTATAVAIENLAAALEGE